MDSASWSPYNQQPFSHGNSGGSPRSLLLSSTPTEDTVNYGTPSMILSPSCPGLQSISSGQESIDPNVNPPSMLNSHFDSTLLSPPVQSSKDTGDFFSDNLFNGICKDNQSVQDFLQSPGMPPRNDSMGCLTSENSSSGFSSQVPPVSFQPKSIDRPSPGPFGVLPHEAVMTRQNRYDRSKDKFAAPMSKTPTPYSNGPYGEQQQQQQQQDVNSVYTSTPLSSNHSVFSTDNSSRSPAVNSVTSPNMSSTFSSPSEYYSSPKNNFGAYNNLQSPVPQSPSVAQHSYPSSPFANIDSVNHIPNAPPCSPMSGGTFVNKLQDHSGIVNQVPQRNGQKSQHSPGNMAGNNNVMCYNTQQQQPQGMVHHGHQGPMQKTPDYHSDYNVFAHNHISPVSYSSAYPAIHSAQVACDDPTLASRPHMPHTNLSHDNRLQYQHQTSVPPSTITSPTYMQSKPSNAHDMMYGPCSAPNLQTSQSMHPAGYNDCSSVINPHSNHGMHQQHNPGSMMSMMMGNEGHYGYQPTDLTDDKNALAMFNSHIDSGVHNPDQSSLTSFLETELPSIETDVLNNRDLRIPEQSQAHQLNAMSMGGTNHVSATQPQMQAYHEHKISEPTAKAAASYSYNSSQDAYHRPGNMTFGSAPRRRGRRGRRRKADINSTDTYSRYMAAYKNDRNAMYNNGFQLDRNKFPEYNQSSYYQSEEYRRYDYFNCGASTSASSNSAYPKTYKERMDAYEFHTPCYTPSKYQSLRKKDDRSKSAGVSTIANNRTRLYLSVEEELRFLGELKFPHLDLDEQPHTFMKTRNKDSEGFLQCYKNFLEVRKSMPDDDDVELSSPTKEHKNKEHHHHHHHHHHHRHHHHHKEKKEPKHQPKLIIKMGRSTNPGEWRLTETHVSPARYSDSSSDENESRHSNANSSSHKASDEDAAGKDGNLSDSKSKQADGASTSTACASEKVSKSSAKRIFKYGGHRKHKHHASQSYPNSQTLSAGKPMSSEKPAAAAAAPKKRGRKGKNASIAPARKKSQHSIVKNSGANGGSSLQVTIKQEVISDEEESPQAPPPPPPPPLPPCPRKLSLRCKKEEPEPVAGPSIKIEPLEVSSDEIDLVDDSDSDPAWTPTSRAPKPMDSAKSASGHVTKRRRKKSSSASPRPYTLKKKRGNAEGAPSTSRRGRFGPRKKKQPENDPQPSEKKDNSVFVVLKTDIDKDKPPIWRVDSAVKILQRFEANVENGRLVYRNTYTYSAWNDFTEGLYIRARVSVVSRSRVMFVVQYLGIENDPKMAKDLALLAAANPLRENFRVYLQSLISQALDSNFLSEIMKENDEYFTKNIIAIEGVTADKKKVLLKDTCDSDLRKCAEIYPCVNVLSASNAEDSTCQICAVAKSEKLVQFYGPPYDSTTLGSTTESPSSNKTQFNVCAICSTSISLYSRLHHQKYNFFVKCRTKMNLVKSDKDVDSHYLLEHCLKDTSWVNTLFHELEEVWKECDRIGIS